MGAWGKRVIFNLSDGDEASINVGIPENLLDGTFRKVRLPGADDLADLIIRKGRGCSLFSLDVARAYRVLRIDPATGPSLE